MKLRGKEKAMRRGACLLALLGMTVQPAIADDVLFGGAAAVRPATTATTPGKTATTPQKFTRSTSNTAGQSNDELRNYYKELFGSEPATPPSAGLEGRSPTTQQAVSPVVQPIAKPKPAGAVVPASATLEPAPKTAATSAAASADESKIVHAEYRDTTAAGEQKIQQIRAEKADARPFPGAALSSSPAPFGPASSASESMKFGAGSSDKLPAAAAVANPAVSSFGPATSAEAAPATPTTTALATPPASSRGSVSFSRTTAPAQGRATPVTAVAGTAAPQVTASASSVTTSPSVTVEWRKQSDLNVGQECLCHLIVKNVGQTPAKEMELRAHFPESVRLVNAKPAPTSSEKFLGWQIDELKPGEERTIEVTMIPLQRGDIHTRADIRFSGTANGNFAVSEPMLDIRLEGPAQVMIGESAAQNVTISNPGTGIATHVQIEALIPEGLEHARGQRLQMDLGNLNPGESRSVRLALGAVKGGPQQLTVNARAESGLTRTATSDVVVIAPSLTAGIQGPGLRYLGRQASFVLAVANDGVAATDNVQMRYKMPSGFDFVSADRGAQFDPATGLVTWFVGRLEKGQKSEIKVTLLARQAGEFKHLVRATSEHGAVSDAEFTSSVEGTSSLAVQVKDMEDPVEVGSETVYEIRVRNEGTAAAKSVALACELADGMKVITAEGPSEFLAEGNTLVFRSLPEVGAGQTVLFKVRVKSGTAGSLRFRAHLSSESVSEPLTAEEMTKFYGE